MNSRPVLLLAALATMAPQISSADEKPAVTPRAQPPIEETFANLDRDGNGKLSLEEYSVLRDFVPFFKSHPDAVAEVFKRSDTDGDGSLSLAEVRVANERARQSATAPTEKTAAEVFRYLDTDGSGKLSVEEFGALRQTSRYYRENPAMIGETFKRVDRDNDGGLALEEFKVFYEYALQQARKAAGDPAKPADSPKPAPTPSADAKPTAEQSAFFEKKIRPVLSKQCYSCHSADAEKIKGGLTLDTREGIRQGGDTGAAVVPGDIAKSLLIEAIHYANKDMQMPPKKKGGKLPDDVIKDFEKWVQMGAPDPREGKSVAKNPAWYAGTAKEHWAFKAPVRHELPAVKDAAWPRRDIDRLILAGLETKDLKPVADAEPRTLIRRLYFDLIGLPPTPEEVEAFVQECARAKDSALVKVVDKLLASPQFGERWGRHWLDVARFAESTGRDVNLTLPHAWRYRDYVIAAFNADKPYDQFIREQIAGDLLPAKNDQERAEQLVATGFLALGSRSLNERNPKQFALDTADEQIDAVSQAVLGLTVACARCHDHKFDPIPQRDYYALAGIFLSTETRFGTVPTLQNSRPAGLIDLPAGAGLPQLPKTLAPAERAKKERELAGTRQYSDQMFTTLFAGGAMPVGGLNNDPKKLVQVLAVTARIGQLELELNSYDADGNPKPLAAGVRDLPARGASAPRKTPRNFDDILRAYSGRPPEFAAIGESPLFARGDVAKPGEKIPRGFLSVLANTGPAIPATESGRRQLADWLVSAENPLTARVFVNRVWHWLFGRGLVESVDNFGTTGTPPANQALLDHLALSLPEHGWSVKKLIREIVLSRAYQLVSTHDEKNFLADPENALGWRVSPRRLDAECIHDAMLAVGGGLQTTPPVGSAIALAGDGSIGGFQIRSLRTPMSDEPFLNASGDVRSVYLPVPRDAVPDALAVFDFSEPNMVNGRREVTTVPAQALYLLNSEFATTQSKRFAEKVLASAGQDERVERAFRLAFSRPPTATERQSAQEFFTDFPSDSAGELTAWTSFCRALFASAEFRILN